MKLELRTDEAVFGLEQTENVHFYIDCACKGRDGRYLGYNIKKPNIVSRRITEEYKTKKDVRFEHTFYIRALLFNMMLQCSGDLDENPVVLVCNDCGREFPFTLNSWNDLEKKIRSSQEPKND